LEIISFIFRPEGVIAVIETNGAFTHYAKPGFMACLPWTNCRYLVSK
jgi:regulator of protease activity HflC (stomatin/prohibitin superfamily)